MKEYYIVTNCNYRSNVRTYIFPEIYSQDFLAKQIAMRLRHGNDGDEWILDDYDISKNLLVAWSNKAKTRTIKVEVYELRELPEYPINKKVG